MLIFASAILVGICFASLLYLINKKDKYSLPLTIILFLLRTATIASLILLLLNPYFKQKNSIIEPSTIIIAQDNSNSIILNKDSIFYKNTYPLILDSIINRLDDNHIIDKYLFGNEIKEFNTSDDIDYQDYYTDINDILNHIKRSYYKKNVGGIVLLSDGICNKSYPPEQNLDRYPFTIHTITLGDTTNHPDIFIKDVLYNKTSPSESLLPIRITTNAINCKDKEMNLTISLNNEIIEEQNIAINSNRYSKNIDFNIESGSEGVKQIDIQIKSLENEIITDNNKKRFFVEVIDKKYKVLCYAKSAHPDLGSINNILGKHFETEIVFSNDEIPNFNNYDIIILHQMPHIGMKNISLLEQQLKENKNTPIFYVIGEDTDFDNFNKIQENISIKKGAVNSNVEVKPNYNNNFGLFSINEKSIQVINNYPPIHSPHLEYSFNNNYDILLETNIMNVNTNQPLLCFYSSNDGRKTALLSGTGFWKWKLYDYNQNNNFDSFEEIVTKSIKYLLTEKDKELIINHKDSFLDNENIIFNAEIRNPSLELITEPDLRIDITNKHTNDKYEFDFLKGNKSYQLNISTLPVGIYTYTARSDYKDKKYVAIGTFSVVNIGAEAYELTANSDRMRTIASQTGGENLHINEINNITTTIENDERVTSIAREEINYRDLINWKTILYIILITITIEWILRKIFGTY